MKPYTIRPQAMVALSRWKNAAPHSVPATAPPPIIAAISSTKPTIEISMTLPGRRKRR